MPIFRSLFMSQHEIMFDSYGGMSHTSSNASCSVLVPALESLQRFCCQVHQACRIYTFIIFVLLSSQVNHRLKYIFGNKNSIYLWFLILTLRRCKITKSVLWDVSVGLCTMLGITLSLPVLQRMEACICEPLWSKN